MNGEEEWEGEWEEEYDHKREEAAWEQDQLWADMNYNQEREEGTNW